MNSRYICSLLVACIIIYSFNDTPSWQSRFIKLDKQGSLEYIPDEKGNIIPDFSNVGYYGGDREIPNIEIVKTVSPSGTGNDEAIIQAAIDEISTMKLNKNGFRGTVLLKKGTYKIPSSIRIVASGIVLRGEGDGPDGTRLVATSKTQVSLIHVTGKGTIKEVAGSRTKIMDSYVPVGAMRFKVSSPGTFTKGDHVIVFRPGSEQWIRDLKMDQIESREGTRQWQAAEYGLRFERMITRIEANTIFLDNPVVMAMETQYGGGEVYKYSFDERISNVGIENIYCESEFETDTSENHAWNAISFDKIEHGWINNVTAKYFGFSCVNLGANARNITVQNSNCFDHKSKITGSRRYSFNNNGQMNLFMNCVTSDGRHDFVTGARVCGPNVFYNCKATKTHADIGPHHRWSAGTLYDNITTDGEINIQDRGNWGSGHGWAGVTQVVWNCSVKRAAIQSPWVSGKNYCIGLKGEKYDGRLKGRPNAEWEGQNQEGLQPQSLYQAQLKQKRKKSKAN